MSVALQPGSSRLELAAVFGAELHAARVERQIGSRVLSEAAKVSRTQLLHYEQGRNLPSLPVAIRLAEALKLPRLVDLARQGRTSVCRRCRREMLSEGGRPRVYCSTACESAYRKATDVARPIEAAKRRSETLSRELRLTRACIEAMCRDCPDGEHGVCRLSDCPLRPVSPLPLIQERHAAVVAKRSPAARVAVR